MDSLDYAERLLRAGDFVSARKSAQVWADTDRIYGLASCYLRDESAVLTALMKVRVSPSSSSAILLCRKEYF